MPRTPRAAIRLAAGRTMLDRATAEEVERLNAQLAGHEAERRRAYDEMWQWVEDIEQRMCA